MTVAERGTVTVTQYRQDLQALRGLAVLAVCLYHLSPSRVPLGYLGVDAFFTLSGYVIALRIRHDIRSGDFSVKRFWVGRVTKLAPPAAIVVIVTVVFGLSFAPISEQRSLVEGSLGALTGTYNWYAMQNSQDYFTTSEALTHFWSLAVEEQTYVLAPLALTLIYTRKLPWNSTLFWTVMVSVTVLSFSSALWLAHSNSAALHYETFSRIWQFSVGAALAVLLPVHWGNQRPPKSYWTYCRTLGFAAVIGLLFSPLVPSGFSVLLGRALATVAVASILSAGFHTFAVQQTYVRGPRTAVNSVWSCLVVLGNHSYVIYLVHWPILYALRNWFFVGNRVFLMIAFALLTAVTTVAIRYCLYGSVSGTEAPKVPLKSAIAMSMAAIVTCLSIYGANVLANNMAMKTVLRNHHCVEVSFRSAECRASDLYFPTAWFAYQDFLDGPTRKCIGTAKQSQPFYCRLGEREAEKKILVVGDSFAEMWLPVFEEQIASGELQVDTLLKSACPIAVGLAHGRSASEDKNCTVWNRKVFAMLAEHDSRYDVIVVGGRYSRKFETDPNGSHRTTDTAYSEAWVTLANYADKVVVIGVGPEPAIDPLMCLHRNDLEDCWAERPNATTGNDAARVFLDGTSRAAERVGGKIVTIEVNDYLCQENRCPFVLQGRVVYVDRAGHLTRHFTSYISSEVLDAMRP